MKDLVLSHKATSLHVRSHCPKLPQLRPTIRARHPREAPTHVCIMYFFTLSFFCSYLSYTVLSMFASGSIKSKDRSYLYSTSGGGGVFYVDSLATKVYILTLSVFLYGLFFILEPNSWTYNFVEVLGHNLESWVRFLRLRFPYTMSSLQTSFKRLFLKKGGGGAQ